MSITAHTFILRGIAVICLAALWQTASYVAPGEGRIVPSLSLIGSALATLMVQPSTYAHIAISVAEIGGALFIAVIAAAAVLLLFLRSMALVVGVATFFYWLAPTPKIIFFPVALGLFGVDYGSKIAIGGLSAFFPIALSLLSAFRQIPQIYLDVARGYRLNGFETAINVYVPCLWRGALTGLRLGCGLGIIGVLLAETKLSNRGLGHLAVQFYSSFKIKELYAVLILIFILAAFLNTSISWLEHRLSKQV